MFYVVSLLTALSISMVYNQWPISRAKWILRRLDHSAIYLLIAGTYTPFLAQLDDSSTAMAMIGLVWGMAAVGIVVKLAFPGRLDRVAIAFYILIGWSGAIFARPLMETLPASTLWFIVAGGVVHTSRRLPCLAQPALPERGVARIRRRRRLPAPRRRHGLAGHRPALIPANPAGARGSAGGGFHFRHNSA